MSLAFHPCYPPSSSPPAEPALCRRLGDILKGFSILAQSSQVHLSGSTLIPYDLPGRRGKIAFVIQRKRENGLPSFGEKLKLEREKRKMTLEEISGSTKIGTRMLRALEEDKFNQLPGGIFNKGFVRAYSRCVGLDEDQTVADYLQASGDAPSVSAEIAGREDESQRDGDRDSDEAHIRRLEAISDDATRQIPWGLLAAILLAVALALFFWSRRERAHKKDALRAAPVATKTQSSAVQSPGANLSTENAGSGSPSSASAATLPLPLSGVSAHSARSASASAAPVVSLLATPKNLATTAEVAGMFAVVVKTREESWISITTDGKSVGSELLPGGSQRVAHGRNEVIVKAGNVGGVDFLFNGKKLDVRGESGEVRTVTFGPRGIIPNAPGPPSTP